MTSKSREAPEDDSPRTAAFCVRKEYNLLGFVVLVIPHFRTNTSLFDTLRNTIPITISGNAYNAERDKYTGELSKGMKRKTQKTNKQIAS